MPRDNLAGSSGRCLAAREFTLSRLHSNREKLSDDRPQCLENPRPEGAESTLTENVASPFHAEPTQIDAAIEISCLGLPIVSGGLLSILEEPRMPVSS